MMRLIGSFSILHACFAAAAAVPYLFFCQVRVPAEHRLQAALLLGSRSAYQTVLACSSLHCDAQVPPAPPALVLQVAGCPVASLPAW